MVLGVRLFLKLFVVGEGELFMCERIVMGGMVYGCIVVVGSRLVMFVVVFCWFLGKLWV